MAVSRVTSSQTSSLLSSLSAMGKSFGASNSKKSSSKSASSSKPVALTAAADKRRTAGMAMLTNMRLNRYRYGAVRTTGFSFNRFV